MAPAVVVGRNPVAPADVPDATVLPTGSDRSVSKTHGVVVVRDGVLHVRDLASTNGVLVTAPDGSEMLASSDAMTPVADGSRIAFGSFEVTVARSSG